MQVEGYQKSKAKLKVRVIKMTSPLTFLYLYHYIIVNSFRKSKLIKPAPFLQELFSFKHPYLYLMASFNKFIAKYISHMLAYQKHLNLFFKRNRIAFWTLPNKQCSKYLEDFLRMHSSNHIHVALRPGCCKVKNNLTSFSEIVSYKGKYLHILFHSFFFVLKMLRSKLSFTGELTTMRNRRNLLQSVWSPELQTTALNNIKIRETEGRQNEHRDTEGRLWQSFTCLTYYE